MRPSLLLLLLAGSACQPGPRPAGELADAAPPPDPVDAAPWTPPDAAPSPLGPHHVWSKWLPYQMINALHAHGDDLVLAGSFSGTIDPGGGPLVSAGFGDVVLARYDGSGGLAWARRGGGPYRDFASDAVVGPDGDIWLLALFELEGDFGGGPLTGEGLTAVLSHFRGDGTHVSDRLLVAPDQEAYGQSVAVDAEGRVAVLGRFRFTIDLGGGPLTTADGGPDCFLVVYDKDGAHVWSKRFGGAKIDACHDLAIADDGDLLVAGLFETTIDFGGSVLTAQGTADGFVARLDRDGQQVWARRMGGAYIDSVEAIVAGPDGSTLATGYFIGSADFGAGAVASDSVADAFVARWDQAGALAWVRRQPGFDLVASYDLALAPDGAVRSTGSFREWAEFDGTHLQGAGSHDAFCAGWAADGTPGFAWPAGSDGEESGTRLMVGENGDVIAAGWMESGLDLGGGALPGADGTFLARWRP